jgi:transcriptional regulator with XRE-family HTH domain
MLRAAQIRAARALLGWGQEQLSKAAGVGTATIRRIETSEDVKGNVSTLARIESAFKEVGIIFLDEDNSAGMGVRLPKKKKKR